jgi:hypothetical protein
MSYWVGLVNGTYAQILSPNGSNSIPNTVISSPWPAPDGDPQRQHQPPFPEIAGRSGSMLDFKNPTLRRSLMSLLPFSGPKTAFFVILLYALPVHAQWSPSATAELGQGMGPINLAIGNLSLSNQSLAQQNRNSSSSGVGNRNPYSHGATRQNMRQLMFAPSSVVSDKMRQLIDGKLLAAIPPEKRPQAQQALSRFQPVAILNGIISKYGYSPYNLADVTTVYWVLCWQLVNGGPAPSDATIHGVDNQLRQMLGTSGPVTNLSNEQKQRLAELMAYEAILGLVTAKSPETSSNPVALATLRSNIASQFQQISGLDIHRINLTPSGFTMK